MGLYRYVANRVATEGTAAIRLGKRMMHLGGEAIELTEDEVARIRGRYVLEEVQSQQPSADQPDGTEQPKAPSQQSVLPATAAQSSPAPAAGPQVPGSVPTAPAASVPAPSGPSTPPAGS